MYCEMCVLGFQSCIR